MNEAFETFGNQEYFHLLWIVPILISSFFMSRKKELTILNSFSENWKKLVAHRYSRSFSFVRNLSFVLCFALIVVAMARPRLGYDWQEKPSGGIDILVAIDVSKSMMATDLKPDRLERAKREIVDLMRLLQGDRIGFIPFAGKAFNHLPLTDDYKMANLFLENIDFDLISYGGTNISEAINLAVTSLSSASAYNSEGSAIILITDGEDHSGKIFEAANNAKEKGVKVFVVGIGSPEGSPLPLKDGGFLKDSSGNVVVSKLAEDDLIKVAETTGGMYVRSVAGDIDLERLYADGIKGAGEDNVYGNSRQKIWNEGYQYPLAGALFFLVLGFFMTPYRKRADLLGFLIIGTMCLASDLSYASVLESIDPSFEKALSDIDAGKNDDAIAEFQKLASSSDINLSHAALFNLGNLHVGKGELEQALEFYKQAYAKRDDHVPTLENMKWVHDQLEQQQKQQNQNQQNQDQQNQDQKKQDQQNQDQKNQDQKNQDQQNQDQKNQDQKNQDQKNQDQKNQDQKNQDQKNQDQKNDNSQDKESSKLSEDELDKKKEEEKSKSQQGESEEQDKDEKDKKESFAQEDDQSKSSGDSEEEREVATPVDEVDKEQAVGLFRKLEENLEAYGRKPKFKEEDNRDRKDW